MLQLSPTTRFRVSPFYEATLADGLASASIYNRMLLPTSYGDPIAEYWRLIEAVSQWDVAVERQVQLYGPEAATLAQILCPRDLGACRIGQGKYVPVCDHRGVLVNDPIVMKLADDRFWFSIADGELERLARCIAAERRLDVEVGEADASPMAVQGPLAENVMAALCGDWVRDLRYFWFRETDIDGIPLLVARSGWSKQGGFEIYLLDGTRGRDLWNLVREAGGPFGIGPGTPATAERTESGLLSCHADTDDVTNPFEVRLGKYVDLDVADDVVGIAALRRIAESGPRRHLLGLVLDGREPAPSTYRWDAIYRGDEYVGDMTHCTWSPRLQMNIGYALISRDCRAGDDVSVRRAKATVPAVLSELPFL